MNRPGRCTQGELNKAVKAALAAGMEIARIEIDKDGKIVVTGKPNGTPDTKEGENEWEHG